MKAYIVATGALFCLLVVGLTLSLGTASSNATNERWEAGAMDLRG